MKILEIFALEFKCFSIDSHCILVRRIPPKSFHLTSPSFYRFWTVRQLSQTENGICVDTHFIFCPLDRLIMRQYWSRSWGRWTLMIFHVQILFRMLQTHFWVMLNKLSNSRICVLVDLRIRQIIRPKMDGGFHRRRHEHSPHQYMCFVCLHWECCVACWHSLSLLQKLNDLGHVLMVLVSFWSRTLHKLPCANGVRFFSHHVVFGVAPPACCFQRPLEHSLVDSLESTRFLILKPDRMLFPAAFSTSFLHRCSSDCQEIPKLCEEFPAPRVTRHQARSRFRHRRAFVRSRLMTSSWHGATMSTDQEQVTHPYVIQHPEIISDL